MLRDIYTMFLTYHHILPDEVGRQNPWVMFKMLDGLNEDTENYDNEHLRMFYGEEVTAKMQKSILPQLTIPQAV